MPRNAMSLHGVFCRQPITPQGVFSRGNLFQMRWINTTSVFAKVVYLKTILKWAIKVLIKHPMC